MSKSEKHPDCPLCLKPFIKVPVKGEDFYVCLPCMISINVLDPCIHQWAIAFVGLEEEEQITCPNPKCTAPMRFFFRTDGFMKSACSRPKCRATVSTELIPNKEDYEDYWRKMKEGQ